MSLFSRYSLGKQATPTLVIIDDHQLITRGIYKYVRHPIYGGSIIGLIGFGLVTQSILVSISIFVLYFKILNDRAKYEEKILADEFGDEYIEYMKNSKKLIPFVY